MLSTVPRTIQSFGGVVTYSLISNYGDTGDLRGLLSRADNLRRRRYLRSAGSASLDFCLTRRHGSVTTIRVKAIIIYTVKKYLFNSSRRQWVWDWCFSLTRYTSTFKKYLASYPELPFPSSLPWNLTKHVPIYQTYTVQWNDTPRQKHSLIVCKI
jgi:hypothetical protein